MNRKIELLAPAGDLLKLNFALAFGADAVYAGVPKFSLRARENSFDAEAVEEGVSIAHRQGKKIYLTLNIFPHNRKIDSFVNTLQWMETLKPDALIVSDPGVIYLTREHCPSIPLHLSTQANTVNWASAKFWQAQGVQRIILSRELSIDEIREIRQRVPDIELESFVHGAICVAYSGRCLLSNYFTHRDPNQGTCTHSCRWDYKIYTQEDFNGGPDYQALKGSYFLEESERPGEFLPVDEDENGTYIMNARDLCAIGLLDQLADAGVDSFKIEGRNKSVYYLGVVTGAYRRALDELHKGEKISSDLLKEMFAVANRGYITGFLEKNPGHLGENRLRTQAANQTHLFCANIKELDSDKGRALISVRNRISAGDKVEALSPGGVVPFKIIRIWSREGQELSVAHGGGRDVWINIPAEAGTYTLIRKKIR